MLVVPISEREFSLYALSLPRGPNFDPYLFHSGWKVQSGGATGAILIDPDSATFGFVTMRRRTDHCWVLKEQRLGLTTEDGALALLTAEMGEDGKPEPLPSGKKRRPAIIPKATQSTSEIFNLLTQTITHRPALMAVGEAYFAMPNPDDNFARDLQTENFDSRIFELYLLACFREQGVFVAQDHVSPDFFIERNGHKCNVEAVTANPNDQTPKTAVTTPVFAPTSREERLTGAPAVRFAKTLRSKLQRQYEALPHVAGKPFALAIADFHAPSSVVWSREALPSYLFGVRADVDNGPDGARAIGTVVHKLLGEDEIAAGLFRDPSMAYLSAIIFSNAATIAKFNRMGYLAGWRPGGLQMIREGILYDRRPGALEPIDFSFDILSEEYTSLWPGGEAWCQEFDVFHNPLAEHPIAFDLLPGATHWFESQGEVICSTIWENSVIASMTTLQIPQTKKAGCEVKSYYLPADRKETPDQGYELTAARPSELTSEDMKRCVAIVADGGAVNQRTMKRDLPLSQIVAIARWKGEIVGVGAIKPVRPEYAARIAAKSEYSFPDETLELGYAAVDPAHRGHGLSHKIAKLLLSQHKGRLFATTDSARMIKTLADAGFRQEGKEWQGEKGTLSFWERKQT